MLIFYVLTAHAIQNHSQLTNVCALRKNYLSIVDVHRIISRYICHTILVHKSYTLTCGICAAKGNHVLFIILEILSRQDGAGISFTFLTTARGFSEIQRSVLFIMIIYEILLFILICLILGN